MEHTKWPKRDDSNLASPGAASPPGAAASSAASPSSVTSVFANGDPPFASKDRSKPTGKQKRSPGSEEAAQNGVQKAAGDRNEEDSRRGGLTNPVNSAGGTLR